MAQEDYFLKIDGIPGASQDDKHKDEIHVSSFSFGVTNAGTGGSNLGSAGRRIESTRRQIWHPGGACNHTHVTENSGPRDDRSTG